MSCFVNTWAIVPHLPLYFPLRRVFPSQSRVLLTSDAAVLAQGTPDQWKRGQLQLTRLETTLTERSCSKRSSHHPFILMYFDPSLPWAARSYLLIEMWNRTWAKYKLVSFPMVGKLTVGCPWSAEGLDLSKPNSLLLEWISTSRCPRTTVMPGVRCTLSATRLPSIPVMR